MHLSEFGGKALKAESLRLANLSFIIPWARTFYSIREGGVKTRVGDGKTLYAPLGGRKEALRTPRGA